MAEAAWKSRTWPLRLMNTMLLFSCSWRRVKVVGKPPSPPASHQLESAARCIFSGALSATPAKEIFEAQLRTILMGGFQMWQMHILHQSKAFSSRMSSDVVK